MIELTNVSKTHFLNDGNLTVSALKNVSLKIREGEFVAIMGPSGSGKSSLLNIIGCLDTIDSGDYQLMGKQIESLSEDQLAFIRLRYIGFVFQSFNLLPRFNALHNVELPMVYANIPPAYRLKRAQKALKMVGLDDRGRHIPSQLSGGQQQRVAIARAIINNPKIIIADEPTGNLDTESTNEIMKLFKQLHASGRTIIFVTHEEDVARYATRIIYVKDGEIQKDLHRRVTQQ